MNSLKTVPMIVLASALLLLILIPPNASAYSTSIADYGGTWVRGATNNSTVRTGTVLTYTIYTNQTGAMVTAWGQSYRVKANWLMDIKVTVGAYNDSVTFYVVDGFEQTELAAREMNVLESDPLGNLSGLIPAKVNDTATNRQGYSFWLFWGAVSFGAGILIAFSLTIATKMMNLLSPVTIGLAAFGFLLIIVGAIYIKFGGGGDWYYMGAWAFMIVIAYAGCFPGVLFGRLKLEIHRWWIWDNTNKVIQEKIAVLYDHETIKMYAHQDVAGLKARMWYDTHDTLEKTHNLGSIRDDFKFVPAFNVTGPQAIQAIEEINIDRENHTVTVALAKGIPPSDVAIASFMVQDSTGKKRRIKAAEVSSIKTKKDIIAKITSKDKDGKEVVKDVRTSKWNLFGDIKAIFIRPPFRDISTMQHFWECENVIDDLPSQIVHCENSRAQSETNYDLFSGRLDQSKALFTIRNLDFVKKLEDLQKDTLDLEFPPGTDEQALLQEYNGLADKAKTTDKEMFKELPVYPNEMPEGWDQPPTAGRENVQRTGAGSAAPPNKKKKGGVPNGT
jgi:hypothetical protein